MIEVEKYCACSPLADDRETLQWLADHNDGMLVFPSKPVYISGQVTFHKPVILQGSSPLAEIRITSPTGDVLRFEGSEPVRVSDLRVSTTVMREVGAAGIVLSGPGGPITNRMSVIERVFVIGQSIGIHAFNVMGMKVRDCYIVDSRHVGIQIYNPGSIDTGDNLIDGCIFDTGQPAIAAIRWYTGGGVRITNNKILSHAYAFLMQLTNDDYPEPLGGTSNLIISHNSFENQSSDSIRLEQLGDKTFHNVQILGNQIISWGGHAVNIASPGPWLMDFQIVSNDIHTPEGTHPVMLYGGRGGMVALNSFKGGTGIVFKMPGVTDVTIIANRLEGGLA